MFRRSKSAKFPPRAPVTVHRLAKRFLVVALFGLASTLALSWAKARVTSVLGEKALAFGGELYQTSLLSRLGKVGFDSSEEISLNGARIRIETTHEALPENSETNPFLERVQKECAAPYKTSHPKAKGRSTAKEDAANENLPLLPSPVVHKETTNEGVLFCLKPKAPLTNEGIEQMLRSMGRSGDLGNLGSFHGVYTRTEGTQLAVLSIETLGPLDPAHMFPGAGDAPGSDISEVPRPSGRRLVSVGHRGKTALTAYESTTTPEAALSDLGKRAQDARVSIHRAKSQAQALVLRTHADSFVVTAESKEDRTIVTVARLPK